MANTDKLAVFAAEARKSGIELRPPCVNSSETDFAAEAGSEEKPGAIRYSLAALKNIGAAAVETVVEARAIQGSFKDLSDFARRINAKALNKRALETLAAAGAFDALEANRALVYGNVEHMLALSQRLASNAAAGMVDLFGGGGGEAEPAMDTRPVKTWTPMERLEKEFEAVGFFLSGHPLDEYESVLASLGVLRWTEFEAAAARGAAAGRLAGILVSARERRSQKGNKFAFAMFSDSTGQFEAVIFSDTLAQARDLLEPGTPLLVSVEAERDGETVKLRVQGIEALDKAAGAIQRGLKVLLDPRRIAQEKDALGELRGQLRPGGKGEIRLVLQLEDCGREMEFVLPGRYDVSPMHKGMLSTVAGVVEVVEM
jgi:DNA polymerase-3 subunit alpha